MFLFCILLQLSLSSYGALGSHRNELEQEKRSLRASSAVQVTEADKYTIMTMTTPSNTVTQFANKDGTIFAVKWRGITNPDLSVILGDHFTEYQNIRDKTIRAPGRKPLKVNGTKFVVVHSGHMRDLQGFAYEIDLFPAGVTPGDLP